MVFVYGETRPCSPKCLWPRNVYLLRSIGGVTSNQTCSTLFKEYELLTLPGISIFYKLSPMYLLIGTSF